MLESWVLKFWNASRVRVQSHIQSASRRNMQFCSCCTQVIRMMQQLRSTQMKMYKCVWRCHEHVRKGLHGMREAPGCAASWIQTLPSYAVAKIAFYDPLWIHRFQVPQFWQAPVQQCANKSCLCLAWAWQSHLTLNRCVTVQRKIIHMECGWVCSAGHARRQCMHQRLQTKATQQMIWRFSWGQPENSRV